MRGLRGLGIQGLANPVFSAGCPGGAAFSPLDIPGLVIWLDASQITGLNDGDMVANWPDVSGGGHHALQATDANKPIYKVNILNGKPIVRFDGSNDYMICSGVSPLNGAAGMTIVAVINSGASVKNSGIVSCHGSQLYCATWVTSLVYRTSLWTTSGRVNADQGAFLPNIGSFVEYAVRYTGANIQHFVNKTQIGVNVAQTGAIADATAPRTSITIGTLDIDPVTYAFTGDMAEVLIYNRSLTDAEMALL